MTTVRQDMAAPPITSESQMAPSHQPDGTWWGVWRRWQLGGDCPICRSKTELRNLWQWHCTDAHCRFVWDERIDGRV